MFVSLPPLALLLLLLRLLWCLWWLIILILPPQGPLLRACLRDEEGQDFFVVSDLVCRVVCILLPHDRGHTPHDPGPQEGLVGVALFPELLQSVDVGLDRQM